METFFQIIYRFNWQDILLIFILTSFSLLIVNKTIDFTIKKENEINDWYLFTPLVIVLTFLLTDFEHVSTFKQWQMVAFQFVSTVIITAFFVMFKGQEALDGILNLLSDLIKKILSLISKKIE